MKIMMRGSFVARSTQLAILYLALISSIFCSTSSFKDALEFSYQQRDKVYKKTFDNGLTVLFYPKHDVPHVIIKTVYKVGYGSERALSHFGAAHVLEHMVFKGTTKNGNNYSETDINAIAQRCNAGAIGEGFNAFTWYDNTTYFFNADKNNWKIFADILADWVKNLTIDPEHLNSELKAVYQELKMREGDGIGTIFSELFPGNHPYAHPGIGFKEEVLRLSADELRRFYQEHYTPENIAVIVVGNVHKDELFSYMERTFAAIAASKKPSGLQEDGVKNPPFYSSFFQKNVLTYSTNPKQHVSLVWCIPGVRDSLFYAAGYIKYALQERLNHLLAGVHKAVYGVGCNFSSFLLDNFFVTNLVLKDDVVLKGEGADAQTIKGDAVVEFCKKIILDEIQSLIDKGITEEEYGRYKRVVANTFLASFESVDAIATYLSSAYLQGGKENDFFNQLQRIEAVSLDDIKNFAYRYLRPFLMHTFTKKPIPEQENKNWLSLRQKTDDYDAALLAKRQRTTPIEPPRYANTLVLPDPIDVDFKEPDKIVRLSNGLDVYLKKTTVIPFVTALCSFKNVESMQLNYSVIDKGLVPSLSMEMLLEASERYSKKQHEEFFDHYGASFFAHSGGAGFTCMTSDIPAVAERFVHILAKPLFLEDDFLKKTQETIEHLEVGKRQPYAQAMKTLMRKLYKDYPWTACDEHEIKNLRSMTRHDIVSFHEKNVVPQNMFLVVVGNFDETLLIDQCEKLFGSWKGAQAPTYEVTVPEIENPPAEALTAFLPEDQVALCCGRLTTYLGDSDMYCLKLLESYLNTILYDVRQKTGIFYSCFAQLSARATKKTKGMAIVTTQVALHNRQMAESLIKNVLAYVAAHGMSEDDLATAKRLFQTDLAKSFTTNSSLSTFYAMLISNGYGFDRPMTLYQKIKNIPLSQVNEVARKYCDPSTWTISAVGRVSQEQSV